MSSATMQYEIVRNRPIAKFKYRGDHSKAVRRTVVLTQVTRNLFTGYEVREGNTTRSLEDNVIKSYSRDKMEGLERLPLDTENQW